MFHASSKKSLLFDDDAIRRLEGAWKDAMGDKGDFLKCTRVVTALEQIRRFNVTISKERKRNARDNYKEQLREVEEAEVSLHLDWSDLGTWERLNDAQAALEEVPQSKLEETKKKTTAHWTGVCDKCNRDFFEFHKDCSKKTTINKLMEGGKLLKREGEIMDYIQRYYQLLYANNEAVENNAEGRACCLASVPRIVTHEMNAQLSAPSDITEVNKALKEIPKLDSLHCFIC